MKLISNISTPVYLKTDKHIEWPKDKLFYILSSDGLFLCRNHEWFQSCVPAKRGPGELEPQEEFASVDYPKIPRFLMEKAVGFFRRIEKDKHWESALILVYDRQKGQVGLVCPEQKASGASVEYDIPKLPQHLALIGDIHSHCNFSPTASYTDEKDEMQRPGLHIVAGYIDKKPEFYCVAVVDGQRFVIKNHDTVFEGYQSSDPDAAPKEWLDKVKPLSTGNYQYGGYGQYGGSYMGGGGSGYSSNAEPNQKDCDIIEKILRKFSKYEQCPTQHEVRGLLYSSTTVTGYVWCEDRARLFIEEWDKNHEKAGAQSGAKAEPAN